MATNILENLIIIKSSEKTKEAVLKELSEAAMEAGYAKPGHYQALLERENKYPTGLHLPNIDVAIPHADPEWANASSITIGILDESVKFKPMGDEGDDVHADLVFMLTILDPKEHIDFLRAFSILMSKQSELLVEFSETGDISPIIELLRKGIPDRKKILQEKPTYNE